MKKFLSMLLICIVMVLFITPVFAIEGEGSSTTDVEYVVEGSFTWSVPTKITVDGSNYPIQVTSFNLEENKKVIINLTNSENYDNGFYLKKAGDNTKYPYEVSYGFGQGCQKGNGVTELNYKFLEVTANNYSTETSCISLGLSNLTPMPAGTYTDTLTFTASVANVE